MNKGEVFLRTWTTCSKACNEIRNMLNDFYSSYQEIDKNAKKFKQGVWHFWGCRIPEVQPRIGLPDKYIHIFKLKDVGNEDSLNFYSFHFIFDIPLLEALAVSEPLIFGARTKMSKGNGEMIINWGQKEGPLEFDFFDEAERGKIIECFDHKGLPLPDGKVYTFKESESGESWETQIIGCPLVAIEDIDGVMMRLVKPLFP